MTLDGQGLCCREHLEKEWQLIAEPASDTFAKNSFGTLSDKVGQGYPSAFAQDLRRALRVSPHPKLSQRSTLGGGLSQKLLNKGSGAPRIVLNRVVEESNSIHGGAAPILRDAMLPL
jgi:hypothetical protein